MRNLIPVSILLAALFLSGCATPVGQDQIALLALDLRTISEQGVVVALNERPEWRAQIESVRNQMDDLSKKPAVTVTELLSVLKGLPFEQLQGSTASLIFAGAEIVIRRAGLNVDLATVADLKPLAAGIADGMGKGLESAKKLLKK